MNIDIAIHKICAVIDHFYAPEVDREALKEKVRKIGQTHISDLSVDEVVQEFQNHVEHFKADLQAQEALQTLFFERLGKLSEAQFHRELLTPELQDLLNPALQQARAAVQAAARADTLELQKLKFTRTMEKVKLAMQLGILPVVNPGGWSGGVSYRLRDLKKRSLAVFKPDVPNEQTPWLYRAYRALRALWKRITGYREQVDFLLRHKPTYFSEEAACFADRYFKLGLVPETHVATIDGQEGSVQLFVNKAVVAKHSELLRKKEYTAEELTEFQKMAIFDFFLGHLDRHVTNWMTKLSSKGSVPSLHLIDNETAFPEVAPIYSRQNLKALKSMFVWRELPLAQQPFTETSRVLMRQMADKVKEMIQAMHQEPRLKGYMTAGMQQLLNERAEDMHYLAEVRGSTPAQLATWRAGPDPLVI